MYAFGDKEWPGLAKLAEEIGEVGQVIGRLMMTHGSSEHWTGNDLRSDLIDEMADVKAAIEFMEMKTLSTPEADYLRRRVERKVLKFLSWHREHAESAVKSEEGAGRIPPQPEISKPSPEHHTEHRAVLRAAGIPSEGCGGEHSAIMDAIMGHGS